MRDRSGEFIREYQLHECIGEGAFAAVYRAEHRLLEHIRAIKIIRPEHLNDPQAMQRFKAEAQVVARLEHPHIISLYEFWVDAHGAYIVMQWMPNGTLEHLLKQHRFLDAGHAARILSQIAPALNLVHEHHLVHRDLKPANILFDENHTAHLADFGLAKWLKSGSASREHIVGTPAYMPPEQADPGPATPITPRADIYSLGVILYEMLTGHNPFGEGTLVEIVLHHLRDTLPPLSVYRAGLPASLDDILQQATAKDPDQRFANVLAFAEAFQAAVDDKPARRFLRKTAALASASGIQTAGDLHARVYTQAGAVLENPRSLLGREQLVGSVLQHLEDSSHILLHGLAGIGKTALAGRVAAQWLEHTQQRVIWVELGRQDADAFFEAIARVLGKLPAIAGTQGEERMAIIRQMLLECEALLIIDNIWNERAILPIIRAVPYSTPLLLTSRIAVSIDGKMIDVQALEAAEALALLEHHAGQPYRDNPHAAGLCQMLGNHPYALEMVGKRLKVYRHLSPQRLLRELQAGPQTLLNTGRLGAQPAQRSIKELLDDSFNSLLPEPRQLMTMIGGVFTARASLKLLAFVTDEDAEALEDTLAELERHGLLHLHLKDDMPGHYRLHDLTYSYVNTLARASSGTLERVLEGIRHFVRAHLHDYDALQFDLMNILGAGRAAYLQGRDEALLDIVCLLVVDANYLTARGPSAALIELVEAALETAQRCQNARAAHFLYAKLGNVYFQVTGQYMLAARAYAAALPFARQMSDMNREAITLSLEATARFKAGMEGYQALYEQASLVAHNAGDANVAATIYNHRSFQALEQTPPDYHEALRCASTAITIARTHQLFTEALLSSLNNRAVAEYGLGNTQAALETHLEAYQIANEMNNATLIAYASKNVGDDYHALGNQAAAAPYYARAYSLSLELGNTGLLDELRALAATHHYDLREEPI